MKVLHINCNYVTTSLHATMISHMNNLTDNTVFCPVRKGMNYPMHFDDNVVVSECFSSLDRVFYYVKQNKLFQSINTLMEHNKFDIIHAYTLLTDGNLAMRLKLRYGIPYVVTIRGTDIYDFFRIKPYLINRGLRIMEQASAVFFLSHSYYDVVFEKYIPNKMKDRIMAKSFIVPNGINDFWFDNMSFNRNIEDTERRLTEKRIKLLCVGRIDKNKNIKTIQKSVKLLEKKGWLAHLEIVGGAENKRLYKSLVADTNSTFFPPKPKEELIAYYRNNDIFVLPSHKESFGLVYAEAMSQGMPVLYTKGQGFDGQFDEGTVGYRVDDNNPKDIAKRVIDICSDYAEISLRCKNKVLKFRWDEICGMYYEIYKNTLSFKVS